ncbi:MAG: NUDIX domain-containing protein [Candidatus Curtissbacteria bacterium]|nr:NUDIX domain-containing protein [Candidatus Curtissbacteria bacterium]
MPDEIIDIVDEKGRRLGKSSRSEACKIGLLHPAVNIFVINSKGQVFLQQRSAKKSAFPLFWDVSASEHLVSGETFRQAAERGLSEELSMKARVRLIRPKHIQKSEYKKGKEIVKEYELVELYLANYEGEINLNKEEVKEGKFVDIKELGKFSKNNFTPWGLDEIRFLIKNPDLFKY